MLNTTHKQKNLAIFGLLFGAMSWGIIWYPYRLMNEAGVSGAASSFYTYSLTVLLGGLIFARHWRGLLRQPKSIILLGMIAGYTNLSYVIAVIDGEVMRVMLLFYLSPLWTLLLSHFWLKEPISKTGFWAIALSLVGAFVMLYQKGGLPLPRNAGEWLAVSAGMTFSLTNVITRQATHLTLRAKCFAVWVGVAGMSLIAMPFLSASVAWPSSFTALNWAVLLVIALLLLLATWLTQYGVSHLLASRAAVIFLFELVVAAIASYFLAGEVMTANEWLGGALIILAAVIASKAE